jgi:hypothetical protein
MSNRYSDIRQRLYDALREKTSWGRNELMAKIDQILLEAADDEIKECQESTPSASISSDDEFEVPPW